MDTTFSASPSTVVSSVDQSQAYSPSWVDYLKMRVDGLPGSNWVFYGGVWLVLFLIVTVMKWWDGAYPVGTFFPGHGALTALAVYSLAGMHYLDQVVESALRASRPALTISDAEYADLAYRLTHMPRHLAWLASGVGVILFVLRLPFMGHSLAPLYLFTSPISTVTDMLFLCCMWAILGVVIYHTIHQLRIVRAIYAKYTRITLFEPGPMYALSRFTTLTAVAITLGSQVWVSLAPGVSTRLAERSVTLLLTALAVIMFVWPLLGLHRRLVAEKMRQQADVAREMAAIFTEVRERVHTNELADVDALYKAATTLGIEESRLAKVPTWPWQPETPRLLASAVLLPIVLWLVQQTLGRFLH